MFYYLIPSVSLLACFSISNVFAQIKVPLNNIRYFNHKLQAEEENSRSKQRVSFHLLFDVHRKCFLRGHQCHGTVFTLLEAKCTPPNSPQLLVVSLKEKRMKELSAKPYFTIVLADLWFIYYIALFMQVGITAPCSSEFHRLYMADMRRVMHTCACVHIDVQGI